MKVANYIKNSFPTTHQYNGINAIEDILFEKKYLIVIDHNNDYKGMLTPCDLIKRPKKIVIDCISEKDYVSDQDTILTTLDKFSKNHISALPVFSENRFVGVVERSDLTRNVKHQIEDLYKKSIISEKVKLAFIDNLSHEVRTPLNGLLGFLDIISKLNTEDFKSKGEMPCKVIRKCTDKFLLTMHDLMDLALIHSGEDIETEFSSVDMDIIFSELKDYFTTEAELLSTDISIKYSIPEHITKIISDEKKIKHILYHLIDNGIKFSYDKKVYYGCSADDRNITIYVSSKSPIIHDDIRDRIFKYFEKPDVLNNGFVNGLGIGLPIVKKLTSYLGGTVDLITSEEATTFYCTIPIQRNVEAHSERYEYFQGSNT